MSCICSFLCMDTDHHYTTCSLSRGEALRMAQHRRTKQTIPPLLRLPLELRQEIYSYLLPRGNVSHPLPGVGITSVSHRLPATALLNITPQTTYEILDYYYSLTTWKLIFSHAFNFFRVDPNLANLARSPTLRNIHRVEVVFFCDILLLKEYPSFGLDSFCTEIERRADRACQVLSQAPKLTSVTVSWIDTTMTGGWEQKARILQPLKRLAEQPGRDVSFRVGEINGPDEVDRAAFVKAMRNVLGDGGRIENSGALDGTTEENSEGGASEMRMLAFDVRQDRRLYEAVVGQSGYSRRQRGSYQIMHSSSSHETAV